MRTDQLITLLSGDDVVSQPIPRRILTLEGAMLVLAGLVAIQILGMRDDLAQVMFAPVTAMKWLLPVAVGVPAFFAALLLTRPQTLKTPIIRFAFAVGACAVLWLVSLIFSTPDNLLWPLVRGSSLIQCLLSIVAVSMAPLAAALWILRDGASPAPMHCGACAGLAAGGFSTAIYTLHCTEDAPLFFLTWYGLAIIIVTCIGAIAGRFLLRW